MPPSENHEGSPQDPPAQHLDALVKELAGLKEALADRVAPPQAATTQDAPPGTITFSWTRIFTFALGNLAILGAFGTVLWTELTAVAEKKASDTAAIEAKAITQTYLRDDEAINALAQDATQRMLVDIRHSMGLYRDEEREIVRTLSESKAEQEMLDARTDELRKALFAQTQEFESKKADILKQIDQGVEQVAQLQQTLNDENLIARAEQVKQDLKKANEEVNISLTKASAQLTFLREQLAKDAETMKQAVIAQGEAIKHDIVNNPELLNAVVADAAEAFSKPGALDDILVRQLQQKVLDTEGIYEPGQRAQALQLMAVFASAPLLRSDVTTLLKSPDLTDGDFIGIALRSFPPSDRAEENRDAVDAVLTRLAIAPPQTDDLREAYGQFLARLPKEQVGQIVPFLESGPPSPSGAIVVDGLAKIGTDEVLDAFRTLYLKGDAAARDLSLVGMGRIDTAGLSPDVRRHVLSTLWRTVESAVSNRDSQAIEFDGNELRAELRRFAVTLSRQDPAAMTQLPSRFETMSSTLRRLNDASRKAIESGDPGEIRRASLYYGSSIEFSRIAREIQTSLKNPFQQGPLHDTFVHLLSLNDSESFLKNPAWPSESGDKLEDGELISILLGYWFEYLEKNPPEPIALRDICDAMVTKLLSSSSKSFRPQLAKVLAFAVQNGSPASYSAFIDHFADFHQRALGDDPEADWPSEEVLSVAIARDADSAAAPFGRTKLLVRELQAKQQASLKVNLAVAESLAPHLNDSDFRKFVISVVDDGWLDVNETDTVKAALKVLATSFDVRAQDEVAAALLGGLEDLKAPPPELASNGSFPEHKRAVVEATLLTLLGYLQQRSDPTSIAALLVEKLPTGSGLDIKSMDLKSVQTQTRRIYQQARKADEKKSAERLTAIKLLDAALLLDPDAADMLNSRCWLKAFDNKLDSALDDCNKSLKNKPNESATLDSRAFVYWRLGQEAEAQADLERAKSLRSTRQPWDRRFEEFRKYIADIEG